MRASSSFRADRGFTLIEAVVTLGILVPVALGLYSLLDSSNRISRQQNNVSQAQQSARGGIYEVARILRQARVGQLYLGSGVLPVYNNATAGKTIRDIAGQEHRVRVGTDVVEVRGVIQGEKYIISSADVACSGGCDGSSQITITIRSTADNGVVNFQSAVKPALAYKARPFYLVVADSSNQPVTVSGKSYLVPLYYVGLVNADAAGSWYTWTSAGGKATFQFAMSPTDAGAKRFNAGGGTPGLQKPFFCGAVDDIVFFVDEGTAAAVGDTHPTLAMGLYDPSSDGYDVQPLVAEAEDFQVAYGVDGADGSVPDGGADPITVDLSAANKDEWIGNVAAEVDAKLGAFTGAPPRTGSVDAFVDSTVATSDTAPASAKPALRALWISLVVKSRDPEMRYGGPGSAGIVTLDSNATTLSAASATGRPYQRRLQSMAVSLRNYQ